ncbi:MAG: hypothetical protein IH571_02850 [Acholeplasmataceae bacterium]|nr:hypothetical protein [Acholeplasmataceae bacterium]
MTSKKRLQVDSSEETKEQHSSLRTFMREGDFFKTFYQRLQHIPKIIELFLFYESKLPAKADYYHFFDLDRMLIKPDGQLYLNERKLFDDVSASKDVTIRQQQYYISQEHLKHAANLLKKKKKLDLMKRKNKRIAVDSLAIVLFEFIFDTHPFKGEDFYANGRYEEDNYIRWYQKETPKFIFHPESLTNSAVHSYHQKAVKLWEDLSLERIGLSNLKQFFNMLFAREFEDLQTCLNHFQAFVRK